MLCKGYFLQSQQGKKNYQNIHSYCLIAHITNPVKATGFEILNTLKMCTPMPMASQNVKSYRYKQFRQS